MPTTRWRGDVAQLGEHLLCKEGVRGSSPLISTIPAQVRVVGVPFQNEVKTVLANAAVVTTVAVTDLERAKRFFQEQLALPLLDETPFAFRFGAGKGTQLSVRRGQPNVGQTVGHFEVDDIEAVVRDLSSRGVAFQEYETPKTTNFIAEIGPARGAWFTDPDGNVFGVREGPIPGAK
jgi:catechol 2,3-dioxygenase-like lactoylglutathione lyase family enzyme